jgi:segregation and condensation protein A
VIFFGSTMANLSNSAMIRNLRRLLKLKARKSSNHGYFCPPIMTMEQETFEIHLPLFEGPFDLLLFFIERDELDVNDIPISKITNDFLEYIRRLETLNIEVASEFILVAATLMRIKSKMLLPRPQLDEQGNEIDPREELIKHLMEYKKYKSVVEHFHKMEETELMKEKRGNLMKELRSLAEVTNVEAELQDVDLFKLLTVFEKVLNFGGPKGIYFK